MSRRSRTPHDPAYLRDLFSRSARYYDPVNVLTSFGRVGAWRADTVALAHIRSDDRVLDAFAGPGGLAERAVGRLDGGGELVLVDLSPVMLHEASRRVGACLGASPYGGRRRGVRRHGGRRHGGTSDERADRPLVRYVAGDLLRQELGLGTFDVVLVGWGLRYVPDIEDAFVRLSGLLRDGGRLVVLEFTRPSGQSRAHPAHLYFRYLLPALAGRLAGDRELHDYLRTSTESFVDGSTLCRAAYEAGLDARVARSRLGGLVTTLLAERPPGPTPG